VKSLKALILAGGFGTRLRPLSCTRPKTLFPIVNKPLLQWTFERLAKNDVTDAILAVNHQTEFLLKQYRIPRCGVRITYSRDPPGKPLGTGGPVKKAEKLLDHDFPFLVLNGDIFADVNYKEIVKIDKKKKAVATIALHRVEDPTRYGVAELDENNRIRRFVEKPPSETAPSNFINAGVYVLHPEIFKYIPENRAVSLEREVFPTLAEDGKLYGHMFDGLWSDIGEPEDYLEINKTLLNPFDTSQKFEERKKVEVKNPVAFDKEVSIGEKSVIGPYTILGRHVIVGKNVHIRDSVIFQNTSIGDSSSINGAVIGEGANIGKEVKIGKGCIVGDHVKIKDGMALAKKVSICPAKEISESVLTPENII